MRKDFRIEFLEPPTRIRIRPKARKKLIKLLIESYRLENLENFSETGSIPSLTLVGYSLSVFEYSR